MKIVCCKCERELGEKRGEGVLHTYCDRCVAVAGLEIGLEKVEAGERRTRQKIEWLDREIDGTSSPIVRDNLEAELDCWMDRVSEIKTKIAELNP